MGFASSSLKSSVTAFDGGLLIGHSQNIDPIVDEVKARQSEGVVGTSDNRHVARVPTVVVMAACEEMGIAWEDRDAVRDMMYTKITSGDWSKFMVHPGGY